MELWYNSSLSDCMVMQKYQIFCLYFTHFLVLAIFLFIICFLLTLTHRLFKFYAVCSRSALQGKDLKLNKELTLTHLYYFQWTYKGILIKCGLQLVQLDLTMSRAKWVKLQFKTSYYNQKSLKVHLKSWFNDLLFLALKVFHLQSPNSTGILISMCTCSWAPQVLGPESSSNLGVISSSNVGVMAHDLIKKMPF